MPAEKKTKSQGFQDHQDQSFEGNQSFADGGFIKAGHANSVVELVNILLQAAIEKSASDIHIEPTVSNARVRYRVDGVLYDQLPIDNSVVKQVVSRIKVLANIDLTEKRIPQDGKFRVSCKNRSSMTKSIGACLQVGASVHGYTHAYNSIDLRVSTFPSIYGEKVVIRILDRSKTMIALDALGFSLEMLQDFVELIERPSGFVLVTGPTGSGKTTTLYAALSHLNSPEKNIITLEDPVEYNLDGITQGQIHPDAGFTFAKGIRSVLRQDPDIAMVGEIRDRESAQIAIEASLTGHQVFSTLHTNDAPGAIMRLMDMRIEPFLINASVTGVLAQRLARKICEHCKTYRVPTSEEQKALGIYDLTNIEKIYYGAGCEQCHNLGYKGRIGIFELLIMSADLRQLISERPRFDEIWQQMSAEGMKPMIIDGLTKVENGIITPQELFRVVW